MAYTVTNYPSKKALKDAANIRKSASVYQPGPFGPDVKDGRCYIEGPPLPATAQVLRQLRCEGRRDRAGDGEVMTARSERLSRISAQLHQRSSDGGARQRKREAGRPGGCWRRWKPRSVGSTWRDTSDD